MREREYGWRSFGGVDWRPGALGPAHFVRGSLQTVVAAWAAAVLLGGTASARMDPPTDPPEKSKPAQTAPPVPAADKQPPEKPDDVPSLDDLLGTGGDKGEKKDRKGAGDPTRADLDRKLSARQAAEQFKQAVDLMGDAAGRIQKSADTGLGTQRVQEDIIRKLDMMIAAAKKQQSQSQSESQSESEQQRKQRQQQSQAQAATPSKGGTGENPGNLPPGQQGLRPGLAGAGAAWGSLPARMRDALLQGSQDNTSQVWKTLTEQYYKKLAEEASK
jgi:hypothetical protein